MRSGIPRMAARMQQIQSRIDAVSRVPRSAAGEATKSVGLNVNAGPTATATAAQTDFNAVLQAQLARGVLGGLNDDEDGTGFGGLLDATQTGLTDLLPRLNGTTGTASLPFGADIKYNPFRDLEVTSPFGTRDLGAGEHQHNGLDLALPVGTPLPAIGAGTVLSAGEDSVFGRSVVYELDSGEVIRYAHLKAEAPFLVMAGQRIAPGQTVGISGNTGASTGPHLHVSVQLNGRFVDPQAYLAELP
jgi:murein DD-endopeptidase MepM/ murein hydrolase activator NlpD